MKCPHCTNSDLSMLERIVGSLWRCEVCSKSFIVVEYQKKKE